MLLVFILFFVSIAGIIGLFVLKYWEARHQRLLAPNARAAFDTQALRLKELLVALAADLEKLPPEIMHLSRLAIHELALALAALLRFLERQAHRLADLVSYKHRFRRRAPRSEFLKKVTEHKNGAGEEQTK